MDVLNCAANDKFVCANTIVKDLLRLVGSLVDESSKLVVEIQLESIQGKNFELKASMYTSNAWTVYLL